MVKSSHSVSTRLLIVLLGLSLLCAQGHGHKERHVSSFFENLKETLEKSFGRNISDLRQTWQDFLQARNDLDLLSSSSLWFKDGSSLAKVKDKVNDMLKRKRKYVSQWSQLREAMSGEFFNMSKINWAEPQMAGSRAEEGRDKIGSIGMDGSDSVVDSLLSMPANLNKDQEATTPITVAAATVYSWDGGQILDKTTPKRWLPSQRGKKWAEMRRDLLEKKFERIKERQERIKTYKPDHDVIQKQHISSKTKSARSDEQVAAILESLDKKLLAEFEPAIQELNATRDAYLHAKQKMIRLAKLRLWQQRSPQGVMTFYPAELANFKTEIQTMVDQKNKYFTGKAELRQAMLERLNELLWSHLKPGNEMHTGDPSGHVGSPENDGLKHTVTETSKIQDGVIKSILDQLLRVDSGIAIGNDTDVTDGLPFVGSLMLAADPPSSAVVDQGTSDASGEVLAVVLLGVVAVAAAAMVLAVMLKWPKKRSLYTRVA